MGTCAPRLSLCWLACSGLAVAIVPEPSSAQPVAAESPCERGSIQSATGFVLQPPDRAEGIALNAPVVVSYEPGTDLDALQAQHAERADACAGELLCVLEGRAVDQGGDASVPDAAPDRVAGELVRVDAHTVRFVPEAELAPETLHHVLVARPGFSFATRAETSFTTGRSRDEDPPRFALDRREVRIAVTDPAPECEAPSGARQLTLRFEAASDDGDPASVEHRLYLAAPGEAFEDPPRARAWPQRGRVHLRVLLRASEANAPLCLRLQAVDGVGREAEAQPELCFDPRPEPAFSSLCAAGRPPGASLVSGARGAWPTLVVFGLMLVLGAFRRRHGPSGPGAQTRGTARSVRRQHAAMGDSR